MERQAPQRDADVGLDPGIPGIHPEPKADAQPLSHHVSPRVWFQISFVWYKYGSSSFRLISITFIEVFRPLTFNLPVSIGLTWASCWQHTDGSCFFNNIFIFESMRERERERGRKLGRERSMLRTRSTIWDSIPDSRITPWVKGRGSTPEPPRHPGSCFLSYSDTLYLLIGVIFLSAFRVLLKNMNLLPLCYR